MAAEAGAASVAAAAAASESAAADGRKAGASTCRKPVLELLFAGGSSLRVPVRCKH